MRDITIANETHLDELARLFNLYRIFYEQEDDYESAYEFIKQRIINQESIVFLSCKSTNNFNGFVQLYPSFCSVSGIPILILYDLYVDKDQRGLSIGRKLMDRAKVYAKDNGFKRLELSTAKDNLIGQSLYESLGYEQDSEFYHYSLEIEDD
ncbi:MAG: GNAT family N-acetyltransferase [Gammaproteobacteria bacterium]|nr:GNAT family N-acetyltransferase [Gammaproteobacteria bacterium]